MAQLWRAETMRAQGVDGAIAKLYLDLLKKCLCRYEFQDVEYVPIRGRPGTLKSRVIGLVQDALYRAGDLTLAKIRSWDHTALADGRNHSPHAETMIGLRRLENLQTCITDVLLNRVPGDLIETGVWRGGAAIFMRAVLKVYGDATRVVWVADSFEGLPRPDPERYPDDRGWDLWRCRHLAVSLDEVKRNFVRYGLLDDQVRFLVGWFRDTLPTAPIDRLSVLRLDGDLYESTMDSLTTLYQKVAIGGYVIVDDYGGVPPCRRAVDEFRAAGGIRDEIRWIDSTGVFWQRLD